MTNETDKKKSNSADLSRTPFPFRAEDLEHLQKRGLSHEEAQRQLRSLNAGTRFLKLHRPATSGDGIETLAAHDSNLRRAFRRAVSRTTKFVPASGAASRMFQDLFEILDSQHSETEAALREFFDQPWPFAKNLESVQRYAEGVREQLQALLFGTPEQEGLADRPKALIPFHTEGEHELTAFEEQIHEAMELAQSGGSATARLHFTVSPEHLEKLRQVEAEVRRRASEDLDLEIEYSTQDPSTDTLAMISDGSPLRDEAGELVLRPGGHGALLHNLQEANADLVLIKNIDNVQPRSRRRRTLEWKADLLGALAVAQENVFEVCEALESNPSEAVAEHAAQLLARFGRASANLDPVHLLHELERPLRLCGVVPNTGEPGGGPFWVVEENGTYSLQIVESTQIDPRCDEQQTLLQRSTHFNPVDLACGLRDRHGNPFVLADFRDSNAYFVASKSHGTEEIRALEHPGLWNGGMAHWLTLFVEAPAATFTPVKTVYDLLRPEHRG